MVGGQHLRESFNEYITTKCPAIISIKIYLAFLDDGELMIRDSFGYIFNKFFISQCNSDQLRSVGFNKSADRSKLSDVSFNVGRL